MTIRIDATLGPVSRGPAPGLLGTAEPPVVLAGHGVTAPFLLEGARVAVVGDERRGDQSIWIDGRLVLTGLGSDGGSGVNVVSAPAGLRRELLGTTSLLEHTFALPTLPMSVVQWSAPQGGRNAGALSVSFTLLPGVTSLRYNVSEGGIRIVPDEDAPWVLEVQAHPAPSWSVTEGPSGGIQARADFVGPGPLTLMVAGGTAVAASRALSAGAHLSAHEIQAAIEADPHRSDGLSVVTGVAEVDHALVWASGRVRRGLGRGAAGAADAVFWAGLGALAVGDDEGARSAVASLAVPCESAPTWPLDGGVQHTALAVLLAARYTLTTGDAALARGAFAGLPEAALDDFDGTVTAAEWGVWSLALATLADALRHSAGEEDIRRLRDAAAHRPARGAMRLPMVGSAPASQPIALHHLLGPTSTPGTLMPLAPPESPLTSWALWAAGEPDAAWAGWRSVLGRGLVDFELGRGCWDPVSEPPGGAPQAALLLCGLAHGLLGLSPDAPSGRIDIAPALPKHVKAFAVREIRVGEARFTLRYRRDGASHRFSFEPTRGRVPPMIVFEPSIPCRNVAAVLVDGEPAEIEVQPMAGRSRVRIQLPLDGTRTLEVEGC